MPDICPVALRLPGLREWPDKALRLPGLREWPDKALRAASGKCSLG
ncbi:hypothetical protein ACJJVG_06265 [Pseudocitrobacter faecalis]